MSSNRNTCQRFISLIGAFAGLRTIFAGFVMLSASTAFAPTAQAGSPGSNEARHVHRQAPVGHRQPTPADIPGHREAQSDRERLAKDNELLDLPASGDPVTGASDVQSQESALASLIQQENARIDRLIRSICRGC